MYIILNNIFVRVGLSVIVCIGQWIIDKLERLVKLNEIHPQNKNLWRVWARIRQNVNKVSKGLIHIQVVLQSRPARIFSITSCLILLIGLKYDTRYWDKIIDLFKSCVKTGIVHYELTVFLKIVITLPAISAVIQFIITRFSLRQQHIVVNEKIIQINNAAEKNLEFLDSEYKLQQLINQELEKLVGADYYEWNKGKIEVVKREEMKQRFFRRFRREQEEGVNKLQPLEPLLEDLEIYMKKNRIRNTNFSWESEIVRSRIEKFIFQFGEYTAEKEIKKYFRYARNQIYKKLYTNTRIIQKEKLNELPFNVKRLEERLNTLYEDLKEYKYINEVFYEQSAKFENENYNMYLGSNISLIARYLIRDMFRSYIKFFIWLLY